MPLTGQTKTDYQRKYMRQRRADMAAARSKGLSEADTIETLQFKIRVLERKLHEAEQANNREVRQLRHQVSWALYQCVRITKKARGTEVTEAVTTLYKTMIEEIAVSDAKDKEQLRAVLASVGLSDLMPDDK